MRIANRSHSARAARRSPSPLMRWISRTAGNSMAVVAGRVPQALVHGGQENFSRRSVALQERAIFGQRELAHEGRLGGAGVGLHDVDQGDALVPVALPNRLFVGQV